MAIMLACEKCPEPLAVDTAKTREELIGIALSNRWTIGNGDGCALSIGWPDDKKESNPAYRRQQEPF